MSDLKIRPLEKADHADWHRLWTDYLTFYETTLPEEIFVSTFERLTDPERVNQNALVAELDGKIVGLTHYITHAHNWQATDVVYLQDLYADPEVRGKGIGRALIEGVYAAADANRTPTVYWMTQDFNTEARKLYDRIAKLTPFIKYSR